MLRRSHVRGTVFWPQEMIRAFGPSTCRKSTKITKSTDDPEAYTTAVRSPDVVLLYWYYMLYYTTLYYITPYYTILYFSKVDYTSNILSTIPQTTILHQATLLYYTRRPKILKLPGGRQLSSRFGLRPKTGGGRAQARFRDFRVYGVWV